MQMKLASMYEDNSKGQGWMLLCIISVTRNEQEFFPEQYWSAKLCKDENKLNFMLA